MEEGHEIAGRYRLIDKLGQGGMGCVWRATHLTLGSEVAIKLIDTEHAGNEEVRARFVREAKAAAQLRSPHVVQILDFGVDNKTPYIAMELMQGESLADRISREGALSAATTARLISGISRALFRAHEAGIIHRDLKPDNVFIVHNDDDEIAKVLDFGIAKHNHLKLDNAHRTDTGAVLGTPYYMSPEQAEGERSLDHRTDIWAMGVIAYECLIGERPFVAESLGGLFLAICTKEKPVPSKAGSVPEGFDAWFDKCTARDVDQRYFSVRMAARELRRILDPTHQPQSQDSISSPSLDSVASTQRSANSSDSDALSSLASSTPGLGVTSLHGKESRRSLRFLALTAIGIGLALGLLLLQLNSPSESEPQELKAASTLADPAERVPAQKSETPTANEASGTRDEEIAPAASAEQEKTAVALTAPSPLERPKKATPEPPRVLPKQGSKAEAAPRPIAHPSPAQSPEKSSTDSSPQPSPESKPRINLGI